MIEKLQLEPKREQESFVLIAGYKRKKYEY